MTKIAIAFPRLNEYSETFIRAHIELLPADITLLHGSKGRPKYYDIDKYISSNNNRKRIIDYMRREFLMIPWERIHDKDISRLLKQKGIQAVLAEYGTNAVGMMNACEIADVPLIAHFRGYDAYNNRIIQKWGNNYHELFKKTAAVIAVSKPMVTKLVEMGANPNTVYRIPSGVDIKKFKLFNPGQTPPVFLFVGRFVEKKAPDLTLFAFQKVAKKIPDAHLVMVGNGPLWEVCKRLAKRLGISNQVDFMGICSHQEVTKQMRNVRAFVQHSITAMSGDSEGTPNSLKEAHASGLPIVATNHGGIPEIVLNSKTGFLVSEGDIDEMAEAMIRLAQDPQLATKMGRAGRKWVEEQFSMEKSIDDLWSIIKSVVSK